MNFSIQPYILGIRTCGMGDDILDENTERFSMIRKMLNNLNSRFSAAEI
jgi:hypothetical protein